MLPHNLSDELMRYGASTVFNRHRASLEKRGRVHAEIFGITIVSRNLSKHDLSDARYTNCVFEGAAFGYLNNVEFAGCIFRRCKFLRELGLPRDGEVRYENLNNVIFYECQFTHTNFDDCRLRDIQFGRCSFPTTPRFFNSALRGLLRIEKCGPWKQFFYLPELEMQNDWETHFRTDIRITTFCRISWAQVRWLQSMPFLQISLAGLAILAVEALLVQDVASAATNAATKCQEVAHRLFAHALFIRHLIELTDDKIQEVCVSLSGQNIFEHMSSALNLPLLFLGTAFCGAIIQKTTGPREVAEFSASDWVIDKHRFSVLYDLISARRLTGLIICLVFYVLALVIFLYMAGAKVAEVLGYHF